MLLNLLKSDSQNPQVGNFLRASVCGFEGNDPKVCCPFDGENTGDTDNLQGEITNTQYGPLYPPYCGYSNATLNKIVNGIPARLGTNHFYIMGKYSESQHISRLFVI